MALNYQEAVYSSYRSSFKGAATEKTLAFGASKLRPVLEPWVRGLSRESRVVDLGCGAGELLLAFKQLGFNNLAGCDLSSEQIEVAKTITGKVAVANLFQYLDEVADRSLEIVTVFDVIEHLSRQATFELFQLAHRKLKTNGLLIGHVPNGQSPFVGHVFYGDPTHEWCPTPRALETLLIVSGYSNFSAAEHLGAGAGIGGRLRSLGWHFVRNIYTIANGVETGSFSGQVWTRNFAFKASPHI